MNLLDQYGWCPFCLSIQNTMSRVAVYYIGSPAAPFHLAPQGILTSPHELSKWLYDHYIEQFKTFTLNEMSAAFVPVAFIKNCPVCPVHLWDIAQGRLKI